MYFFPPENFIVAIPLENPHFWTFSCCVRLWNCAESSPFLQVDVLSHPIELFLKKNTLWVRIGDDETETPFAFSDGVWTGIDFVYDAKLELKVSEKSFVIEKACPGLKSCRFGNEFETMDVLSFQANQRQVLFSFSFCFELACYVQSVGVIFHPHHRLLVSILSAFDLVLERVLGKRGAAFRDRVDAARSDENRNAFRQTGRKWGELGKSARIVE